MTLVISLTFDVCASLTSFTICERALSAPTCVASITMVPCWLSDPPITSLPGFLLTGIDSPVINDSSHVDSPSNTRPSTGIFSPGSTWPSIQQLHTTSQSINWQILQLVNQTAKRRTKRNTFVSHAIDHQVNQWLSLTYAHNYDILCNIRLYMTRDVGAQCRHDMRLSVYCYSGERVCNFLLLTTIVMLIASEVFDIYWPWPLFMPILIFVRFFQVMSPYSTNGQTDRQTDRQMGNVHDAACYKIYYTEN